MDITQVSQLLSARTEEVCRHLLPSGQRHGSEWCVGNLSGDTGDSLKIHLTGAKAGVWSDFSTGERGADLLDLWAASRRLTLAEALREAKAYLGIVDVEVRFSGTSRQKSYRKPDKPECWKPGPGDGVYDYLTSERVLSQAALEAYWIREKDSTSGPVIVFPFSRNGELVNVKYLNVRRRDGKKESYFERDCMLCLWGWQTIPDTAREVVICEGEIDAMSWFDYGLPALSVPNGAKSFTWLENEFENLDRFETIYLSWDMDQDGRAGVKEAIDRLGPHRCRVVELPHKDANACIQAGVTAEQMKGYLSLAATCDPAELKRASVFVEEVIQEFYPVDGYEPGFLSPWSKLHGMLRFRPAEFSVWSGFSNCGKTTLLGHLMLAAMEQDEKACIASLEIKPRKLLRRLTRQATAERQPQVQTIRDAHLWYDGRLWIFDLVGSAKVKRLFEVFEYARRKYGITQFVIDSLMRCGIAEDDYNGQKELADRCAEFSTSHDCQVHLVAHSRKKESEKQAIGKLDVKGTGTITDLAHNVYVVVRNREKEKQIEAMRATGLMPGDELLDKPDAFLICDKTREGEWMGQAGLWFDIDSFQYLETRSSRPNFYVVVPEPEREVEVF